MTITGSKGGHHLKQLTTFTYRVCILHSCGSQNYYFVSHVDTGESCVETKTEADCKDITETEHLHHDVTITGMFGFL